MVHSTCMPEEPNVIKSKLKEYPIPDITFSRYLHQQINKHDRNGLAIVSADEQVQLTWAELNQKCHQLARGLLNCGLQKEDLILFFGDNSLQYALCELATTYLGLTFSPLSPANGPFELVQQLVDCKASVMLIDQAKLPILRLAMKDQQYNSINIKLMVVMNAKEVDRELTEHTNCLTYHQIEQLGKDGPHLEQVPFFETSTQDYYIILYTSGTTGLPKGAVHTHKSWMANLYVKEEDESPSTELLSFPMGHLSGTMILCSDMIRGIRCILVQNDHIDHLFTMVEKHDVQNMLMSPATVSTVANGHYQRKYDLSTLKKIYYGGSKTPSSAVEAIKKKLPHCMVMELYGATEFFSGIRIRNYGEAECLPGNVGTIAAGHQMKIVDINTGHNLAAFQQGEICVRGAMCFVGYLRNPEATAKALDANGWYHTGDIGYYDQYGQLYIVDRIKEMIKYKGWSITPAEIEDFIFRIPTVDSVCVVGVTHLTDGQLVRAYVLLKPDVPKSKQVEEEIHQLVNQNLGFQKQLRGGIIFVDQMPRTVIGKVDRKYFNNLVKQEVIEEVVVE